MAKYGSLYREGFAGYTGEILYEGKVIETVDMSIEGCEKLGVKEHLIPCNILAASGTTLDTANLDGGRQETWLKFVNGEFTVRVRLNGSDTWRYYDWESWCHEADMELAAG